MNTQEILIKTKELIQDPKHWIKRGYFSNDNCYCLVGAINMAVLGVPMTIMSEDASKRYILREAQCILAATIYESEENVAVPEGLLLNFNDNSETIHADVMNVLDKAIKKSKK